MTDRQQNTTFPAPPPFYKHFTRQNLDAFRSRRKRTHNTTASNGEEALGDAALEDRARVLQYLTPPDIPADGKWRAFGVEHMLDAKEISLQDAGVEKLFPDHPSVELAPQAYLLTMARSLLTTFLSMTGILAQNPTLYGKKVEDLRTIAVNMHYLINQYRPHQAREALISLMDDRLDSMRSDVEMIERAKDRLNTLSRQLNENEGMYADTKSEVYATDNKMAGGVDELEYASTVWEILDQLPIPNNQNEESTTDQT